jgi:hypothetical protein
MSGENGRATPPAEGAPPAVDTAEDATTKKAAAVDAAKDAAPVAESEAEPAPAPAPAAAEPSAESDKAAEGTPGPCRALRIH